MTLDLDYIKDEIDPNWPVMFLDIDGVLNGTFFVNALPEPHMIGSQFIMYENTAGSTIDFNTYERFIDIIKPIKNSLQIILISSCFKGKQLYSEFQKESWMRLFHTRVPYNIFLHNVVGTAPYVGGGIERGKCINEMCELLGLESSKTLIVDDSHDTFVGVDRPPHRFEVNSNFIMPSEKYGLEGKEFEQLLNWVIHVDTEIKNEKTNRQ